MDFADVRLPGGIRLEGNWRRDAVLRPLAGRDEAFLLQQGSALSPAARTTAMLARCLCRLGPISDVTAEIVRSLSDRRPRSAASASASPDLRRDHVLRAHVPACAEKLDLELEVSELLLPPYGARERSCTRHRSGADDVSYRVRFRLPNGADQERAATLVATAPEAAAELCCGAACRRSSTSRPESRSQPILRPVARCIGRQDGRTRSAGRDPARSRLPGLRRIVPDPVRRRRLFLPRDPRTGERSASRGPSARVSLSLERDGDILRLTRRKRLLYLDLLSATLSEGRLQ